MAVFVLDTDILSLHQRNDPKAAAAIARHAWMLFGVGAFVWMAVMIALGLALFRRARLPADAVGRTAADARARRTVAVGTGLTVVAIFGLLLAIAAVVAVPIVLSFLPLGSWVASIVAWLRWPALIVLVIVGFAALYRFGPNRPESRWEWLTPGAVFAALAWIAGSALLSWYLSNFADYNATQRK